MWLKRDACLYQLGSKRSCLEGQSAALTETHQNQLPYPFQTTSWCGISGARFSRQSAKADVTLSSGRASRPQSCLTEEIPKLVSSVYDDVPEAERTFIPTITNDTKDFSSRTRRRRGHGEHGDDRHRGDDRVDGNAADRCAARANQPLFLGLFVISPDTDSNNRRVRKARGYLWPQADDAHRHRDLSAGFGACGLRVVDAIDDCLPVAAGRRCGRHTTSGHDRDCRPVSRKPAGQGSRLSGKHMGAVGCRRTGSRQSRHPQSSLGLGILDQRACRTLRSFGVLSFFCTRRNMLDQRPSTCSVPPSSPFPSPR